MLVDMNEWQTMNRVYATYFKYGSAPARASFGVTALAIGARVEIDCIALTGPIRIIKH
jgi:enamine deaminase RidA (YjgF/YER057c/UK114 family)